MHHARSRHIVVHNINGNSCYKSKADAEEQIIGSFLTTSLKDTHKPILKTGSASNLREKELPESDVHGIVDKNGVSPSNRARRFFIYNSASERNELHYENNVV